MNVFFFFLFIYFFAEGCCRRLAIASGFVECCLYLEFETTLLLSNSLPLLSLRTFTVCHQCIMALCLLSGSSRLHQQVKLFNISVKDKVRDTVLSLILKHERSRECFFFKKELCQVPYSMYRT